MRQRQQKPSSSLSSASLHVLAVLVLLLLLPQDGFSFIITTTATATATATTRQMNDKRSTSTKLQQQSANTAPPSWEELSDITKCDEYEQPIAVNGGSYSSHPSFDDDDKKPILYRERHGWCPYSERVWLALEVLEVDYNTIYIDNIYGRPNWYNGNTPQIKWPDINGGKIQSESMDLVREINKRYNGRTGNNIDIDLYPDDIVNDVINKINEFDKIFPRCRPSSRAAFLFRYDGETLLKNEFETVLKKTEELLAGNNNNNNNKDVGPFFCGSRFTAADIAWVPFLERYAGQLPCLHDGLNPKCQDKYPYLYNWYKAMETTVPVYGCRIRGDHSSWRKVLTMAGFANAGNVPQLVNNRMDEITKLECEPISKEEYKQQQTLWDQYVSSSSSSSSSPSSSPSRRKRKYVSSSPSKEAASVLIRNRENIIKDIISKKRKSLPTDTHELDETMRSLAYLLCNIDGDNDNDDDIRNYHNNNNNNNNINVKALASFLDDRMCVPR
jgi:glutathione S-transferase